MFGLRFRTTVHFALLHVDKRWHREESEGTPASCQKVEICLFKADFYFSSERFYLDPLSVVLLERYLLRDFVPKRLTRAPVFQSESNLAPSRRDCLFPAFPLFSRVVAATWQVVKAYEEGKVSSLFFVSMIKIKRATGVGTKARKFFLHNDSLYFCLPLLCKRQRR